VGGEEVLDTLEKLPRKDGTERPVKPVMITKVVMYVPITSPATFVTKATQLSRSFRRLQSQAGEETREESGSTERC
jgi:peptidyl-prolyl cis-trans isomerase-like 2